MNLIDVVNDLIKRSDEEEWFEFKVNWFEEKKIGQYISALSNSASILGKEYGYLVWGIDDKKHDVIGTNINPFCSYKNEPFQNHLARNLKPSIAFQFDEIFINNDRLIVLTIPCAKNVPTSFNKIRFSRIGSSIASLEKYPEREGLLWNVLIKGYPTMINTESPIQDLTFSQLKNYYLGRNLIFNDETFKINMHLLCDNGKYNMLACFLADNGSIPVRVSIFSGLDKSKKLFSVKEFGNQSLVLVIDRIIDYADSINMTKSIEDIHSGTRTDVPLFNQDCFNEAVKNAFIHNNWLRRVAPMITFFEDRIEITSFSSLAPKQTIEGFYKGYSIPVNEDLSSIFLATHLSERTGKGNPLIVSNYGRKAFKINEDSIIVTIPYNWIRSFKDLVDKAVDKLADKLNKTELKILYAIKENPKMSQKDLYDGIKKQMTDDERYYLLLDEVQEICGWEKAINSLLENANADIYVTGSNSKLMSGEISTYLTGRYVSIPVYPLSFAEYLDFKKQEKNLSMICSMNTCASVVSQSWRWATLMSALPIKLWKESIIL